MKRRRLTGGKQTGYIFYEITTINKTYGDSDFTNPLSIIGGNGIVTITYTSSSTSVATVDSSTGEVTVLYPGETTITATITETIENSNYTYDPDIASYTLIVGKAPGYVSEPPEPETIVYDGNQHQLTTAGVGTGTMLYRLGTSGEFTTSIPTGSDVGTDNNGACSTIEYVVYYKTEETATHTESEVDSVTVTILKADSTYSTPTATSPTYNTTALNLLVEGSTSDGTIEYSSDGTTWSETVPKGTNAGHYTSWWRLIGDCNHNNVSSTSITTTLSPVIPTVTPPCEGVVIPYDGETHELIQCGSTDYGTLKYSLDGVTYSTTIPTASAMDDYIIYWMVEGDNNIVTLGPNTVLASIGEKIVLNPTINLDLYQYTYTGSQICPNVVSVLDDDDNIIDPSEYTVSYSNNINAGTATVIITDVEGGRYTINGSVTFTINLAPVTACNIIATTPVYNCSPQDLLQKEDPTCLVVGGTLKYSVDGVNYSTTIPKGTNAGVTYYSWWKIDPDSNYFWNGNPTRVATEISPCTLNVTIPTAKALEYNGSALELANPGSITGSCVRCTDGLKYSLDESTWSSSMPTATNGGAYTLYYKVDGDSNINGVYGNIACSISEKPIFPLTVELSQNSYEYDSTVKTPSVTVKDGNTIIPSSEYTVTYSNNINAGTATVTISDNTGGNYTFVTATVNFTITLRNVTVDSNSGTFIFDGQSHSISGGDISPLTPLLSGHAATITTSGSGTTVGTYTNTITSVVIRDTNTNDVTGNYNITYNNNTITILTRPLYVTADNKSKTYGSANPTLTYSYSNNVSGYDPTFTGSLTTSCTNTSPVGTYDITLGTLTQTNSNYDMIFTKGTLTVNCNCSATASAVNRTYNGTTDSNGTSLDGVSGSNVTWSGTTSATNAGDYTAYATPVSNYCWSDNCGTAARTINWTMSKRGLTAPVLNGDSKAYHNTASASVKTAGTVSGGTATAPGTLTWSNQSRTAMGTLTATAYYAATSNFSASPSSAGVNVTITCADDLYVTVRVYNRTYNGSNQVVALITDYHGCTPYLGTGSSSSSVSWLNANTSVYASGCGNYLIWKKGIKDSNHCDDVSVMSMGIASIFLNCDYSFTAPTAKSGLVYNGSAQTLLNLGSAGVSGSWSLGSSTNPTSSASYTFTPSNGCYCTKSGTVSVSLAKYTPTVTLSATDKTCNGSALYASATVSKPSNGKAIAGTIYYGTSSGATTYSVSYSGSAVNLSSVSITNAGSTTVYAYFVPNSTCNDVYNNSGNASKTMTISRGTGWTGFNTSAVSITYSATTTTKSGSGASGTLSVSSSNTGVATVSISGNTITLTRQGYGSATITVSAAQSACYNAASSTFTINCYKHSGQIYSYTDPGAVTFSTSSQTVLLSASATGTVSYDKSITVRNSSNSTVSGWSCTSAGKVTIPASTSAGTYTVAGIVMFAESTNYYNGSSSHTWTVTINKASGSITCPTAKSLTYNGSAQALVNAGSGTGTIYYKLGNGSYSTSIPTATNAGTYTVYAYAAASTNYNLSSTCTVSNITISDPYNGHAYVDLGLPSGKKWATMNIGASSESDYGYYFSWGNTTGYTGKNNEFSSSGYGSTTGKSLTGNIPSNSTYDAAVKLWGGNWRIPTKDEFVELTNNTTITRVTINGKAGVKFTNKNNSSKYIFLPPAGAYTSSYPNNTDKRVYLWTSTYKDSSNAYEATFYNGSGGNNNTPEDSWSRFMGLPIRPIAN